MLERNVQLAAQLRLVPGLVYLDSRHISTPGVLAWSRREERPKRQHCRPIWQAPTLNMPLHYLVEGVQLNSHELVGLELSTQFPLGTWATLRKGPYKGDFGIIVYDDYELIDTDVNALMIFIPRIRFPRDSPVQKRPPQRPQKAALDVDFSKPFTEWRFQYKDKIKAQCPKSSCRDPFRCNHQPPINKRYTLFGQTLCGGFALVRVNLADLTLATRLPNRILSSFTAISRSEVSASRVPPPPLWTFLIDEQVIFQHTVEPPAMPWGKQRSLELRDLADGDEGIIRKVEELLCEVWFTVKGLRIVPYRNLFKKLSVGQTVKLCEHIGSVKEIKRVELGGSPLSSLTEASITLGGTEGTITDVYMDPNLGPSVSVWIQQLDLIVSLDRNSVVDSGTDQTVYTQSLVASTFGNHPTPLLNPQPRLSEAGMVIARKPSTLRTFDDPVLRSMQGVHPAIPNFNEQDVGLFDVRNGYGVQRSDSVLLDRRGNRVQEQYVHPSEYFGNLGGTRRPGRLPWLGVRVGVIGKNWDDRPRPGYYGVVLDVYPDAHDPLAFLVVIHWFHGSHYIDSYDANKPIETWPYNQVRRIDNSQLLHEFTPYTGQPPWRDVEVRVTKGLNKGKDIGRVLDVKTDSASRSGLLLLIEFQFGYVQGRQVQEWVDYDNIRRSENGRFLHESLSSFGPNGPKSYFACKVGYIPDYTEQEKQSWYSRPIPRQVPSPPPVRFRTPPPDPYMVHEDPAWNVGELPIPKDFWLLDRRIAESLGPREIYVALGHTRTDVRVSIVRQPSGAIELRSHRDHKGGRTAASNGWYVVNIRELSMTPCSYSIKGSEQANGLYLVCSGIHTGKLVRRLLYTRATPPNQDRDIWLMQVVQCDWEIKGKKLMHTESLVNEEIQVTKGQIVLVHETDKTREQACKMLVHSRLRHKGHTNGWTISNDRAVRTSSLNK